MAGKPKKSTYEYYRAMLVGRRDKGADEFPGLRSFSDVFTPANGYDLHEFASWSKHKRAKVAKAFHDVQVLRSQNHHVYRSRNAERLEIAQRVSHADIKVPGLKVAFVKYTRDRQEPDKKPELIFKGDSMIVRMPHSDKQFIPFDKPLLFSDPAAEFQRIREESGERATYTIQAGAYEVTGRLTDFKSTEKHVRELMARYDGKNIPANHRNSTGWNPKHHEASKWLDGINAYKFHPGGGGIKVLGQGSEKDRNELKKKRRAESRKMRRIRQRHEWRLKNQD